MSAELRITINGSSPEHPRRRTAAAADSSADDDFTRSVKSRTLQIKAKERAEFDAERRLSEQSLREMFSDYEIEMCSVVAGNKGMVLFREEGAVDAVLEGYQEHNDGSPPPVDKWIKAPSYPPWLKLKILSPRKLEEEAAEAEAASSREPSRGAPTRGGGKGGAYSSVPLGDGGGESKHSAPLESLASVSKSHDLTGGSDGDLAAAAAASDLESGAPSPPGVGSMVSVWDVALDMGPDAYHRGNTSMPVVNSPSLSAGRHK